MLRLMVRLRIRVRIGLEKRHKGMQDWSVLLRRPLQPGLRG